MGDKKKDKVIPISDDIELTGIMLEQKKYAKEILERLLTQIPFGPEFVTGDKKKYKFVRFIEPEVSEEGVLEAVIDARFIDKNGKDIGQLEFTIACTGWGGITRAGLKALEAQ